MQNKLKKHLNKFMISDKKIYFIINLDNFSSDDDILDYIASLLYTGVDVIQITWEKLTDKKILEIGSKIKLLCAEFDATFIIKSRADIAFLLDADGVSLNPTDLSSEDVRKILGDNTLVGIDFCNYIHEFEYNNYDFVILENNTLEKTNAKNFNQQTDIPFFVKINLSNDFKNLKYTKIVLENKDFPKTQINSNLLTIVDKISQIR